MFPHCRKFLYHLSPQGSPLWKVCCYSVDQLDPTLPPHELQHARSLSSTISWSFVQIHVHWVNDAIQPSYPLPAPPSPPALNLSQHQCPFQWVSSLASGSQNTGASASVSASVLPMNIQCWFAVGLIDLMSLLSKGLSRVFSRTTVQKHQFIDDLPSLWSISHTCTWLLENVNE